MEQTGDELQHPEVNSTVTPSRRPNLPCLDLFICTWRDYLQFCVPLYEASIRGDWRAAKVIFDTKPELVKYALTRDGQTALHVAASARCSRRIEKFVKNLVDLMEEKDLALETEEYNTALYLAAAVGNLQTVKIMMEKNKELRLIPGNREMMPLSVAALNGNHQVVKYLYDNSSELGDDGWTDETRGRLLERCVTAEMFDIALKIGKKYGICSWSILEDLAGKPDAFFITKSNIIERSVKSAFALIGMTVGAYEKESEALQLLKISLEGNIAKYLIRNELRGRLDPIKQKEKLNSENIIQVLGLQKVIFEHLDNMDAKVQNITSGTPNVMNQDTESTSGKADQAMELQKLINEHLVSMHGETQNIVKQVSDMGYEAKQLQKLISEHIVNMHVDTQKIIEEESEDENRAKCLKELIAKNIKMLRTSATMLKNIKSSSHIPFIAAEKGNTKFLIEFIRIYPDLIWSVNGNNHTIFHIAVKNRDQDIYNLLYEIGPMKDKISDIRDLDNNNILHLVGKSAKKKQLEDVSGAALQMQRELLWFKEVRNMVPPKCREQDNKDGLTPLQLFTEEHKDLMTEGEKWMKEKASQCMVVAALIATIVFAAAFTVPGGYNQNDGIPLLYRKPTFVVFVVADAISLFLSSTSILTFLSILTSRFAERDFVEALPTKLMIGLVTLFLSITTMMITFGISFFVLYHKEMKWVPILICASAVMPVLLYVVLQYHLLVDVVRLTYGSKYLFKPGKQVLYYTNQGVVHVSPRV